MTQVKHALASRPCWQIISAWGVDAAALIPPALDPGVYCICFDGVNDYKLGTIVQTTSTTALCYLPAFFPDGALSGQSPCLVMFAPLTK